MSNRGYFGIGIFHGKHPQNIGTLWRSANLLGAGFIFTIGARYKAQASDTLKTPGHTPLYTYLDFEDFKKHLPWACRIVGIELDEKAKEIETYSHPQSCVYLLGAEDHGLNEITRKQCHELIKLPGRFSMNVASAGTVVMYDRILKRKVA